MSALDTGGSRNTVAERNRKLLESGKYSDFTITCKDRDIKVHRVMLQNAGGYFESALNGLFQEATANVINLDVCDSEAVHAMLQYIYHDDYAVGICSKAEKADELTFHAKVDRLGKRMLLDGLQERATCHLKDGLIRAQNPKTLEAALFKVASYVYDDAAAFGDAFRTVIAKAIAQAAYAISTYEPASMDWSEAFKDSHPLASDLIHHGIDLLKAKLTKSSERVATLECLDCGQNIWVLVDLANADLECPFCRIDGSEQSLERLDERTILDDLPLKLAEIFAW